MSSVPVVPLHSLKHGAKPAKFPHWFAKGELLRTCVWGLRLCRLLWDVCCSLLFSTL